MPPSEHDHEIRLEYADFLTYCTNAVAAQKEVPRLQLVQIAPQLQVGALYRFTMRQSAPAAAQAFAKALVEL